MLGFFKLFKKLASQLRGENLHRVILVLFVLIMLGSTAFFFLEENLGFFDAFWWSIVTVTTVGYGDISPATLGGKIIGMLLMMLGIGFLGVLTATIASIFVENKLMENRGMKSVDLEDHYIICGWNYRGAKIIHELRDDEKSKDVPIVIIADLDEKPLNEPGVEYVRGEINEEALEKAKADKAQTAIMLSDDDLEITVRDAKTILDTLTIKSIYPELYVCVELMQAKNVEHCKRAKADEIVVVGEISTNLLAQAALDHGITHLITELVSQYGQELYKIDIPPQLVGKKFIELLKELKEKHNIICLGVEKKKERRLIANPEAEYTLDKEDQLVVIAFDRPDLTGN